MHPGQEPPPEHLLLAVRHIQTRGILPLARADPPASLGGGSYGGHDGLAHAREDFSSQVLAAVPAGEMASLIL